MKKKEIIFTTTNKYKVKAAESVLNKYGISVVPRSVEVSEIQANTAEEVLLDKLQKCYQQVGKPLIAMDSGLFIKPLNGFPGVYTKYILDTIGEDGLLKLTADSRPCQAYVQRVVGYTDGEQTKVFVSQGQGEIIQQKRGTNGMNYDLIFYVPLLGKTLAELETEDQVRVWGDAWDQLAKWLLSQLNQ